MDGRVPVRLGRVQQCAVREPANNGGQEIGLNPILTAAANSTRGVMGKMIASKALPSPPPHRHETVGRIPLFRFTFWHSVLLVSMIGW